MSVPVNLFVVTKAPERYGAILYQHGLRPARKTPGNWWRIVDDRQPGAAGIKRLIQELAAKHGLTSEWRPMRRSRPKKLRRPLPNLPRPLTARPRQ